MQKCHLMMNGFDEAEATIARIGASLNKHINGDQAVRSIINNARQSTKISTVLETLVRRLIDEHKERTGQQVRFCKLMETKFSFTLLNHKTRNLVMSKFKKGETSKPVIDKKIEISSYYKAKN